MTETVIIEKPVHWFSNRKNKFFCLQRFFNLVLTSLLCFSMSRLSFWNIILEETIFVSGEIFFVISHIFFTDLKLLILFVRSLVPAWTCVNFGVFFDGCFQFLLYDVTCCIRMVNDCDLFDFERPRLLILFSMSHQWLWRFHVS